MMRRTFLALFLASLVLPLSYGPAVAENLLSLNVGVFSPGDDYPSSSDEGGDFGIFYTNTFSVIGFELGMHGYGTSVEGGSDVSVVGGELLLTFQNPLSVVQPYAGLGFGVYSIEVESRYNPSRTYNGSGPVAEAGFRVFLQDVFMGLQYKIFRNDREDRFLDLDSPDYGGQSISLTLGTLF